MNAPEVSQDVQFSHSDIPDGWCMTLYARLRKAAQVCEGNLRHGGAERVRCGEPARAEDNCGVETLGTGLATQCRGARLGQREGIGCHGPIIPQLASGCHGACYRPVISVTEWQVSHEAFLC